MRNTSQAPSTWLHWLVSFEDLLKGGTLFQSLQVLQEDGELLKEHALLDHRRPPNVVPNHTVCGCEPLSTDVLFPTQVVREDVGRDIELAHHRVHKRLVAFLLWCVCELHVQWLKDLVKGAGRIADETGGGGGEGETFNVVCGCMQNTTSKWRNCSNKSLISR